MCIRDRVRWGLWPLNAVSLAVKVAKMIGIDYTAIDIMVDQQNNAYFIEANSNPNLPLNSDGSTTYRHNCIGRALKYAVEVNRDNINYEDGDHWSYYIHPALSERAYDPTN